MLQPLEDLLFTLIIERALKKLKAFDYLLANKVNVFRRLLATLARTILLSLQKSSHSFLGD